MKKLDYSALTNESVVIDLTDEEIEQFEKDAQDYLEAQALAQAEAEAKAEAKATAQAKLAALGLTVEDLTALGL